MQQWAYSFDAQHPHDPNQAWRVGVSERKIKVLKSESHETKLARFLLVPDVMKAPVMIIGGWSRLDKDGCFVYVGKPANDHHNREIILPAPPGCYLLVFVLPDGTI